MSFPLPLLAAYCRVVVAPTLAHGPRMPLPSLLVEVVARTVVVLGTTLKFRVPPALRVMAPSAAVRLVAEFWVRVTTEPPLFRVVEAKVCEVTALPLPVRLSVPPAKVSTLPLLMRSVGVVRFANVSASVPPLTLSPPVKVLTVLLLRVSVPNPPLVRPTEPPRTVPVLLPTVAEMPEPRNNVGVVPASVRVLAPDRMNPVVLKLMFSTVGLESVRVPAVPSNTASLPDVHTEV